MASDTGESLMKALLTAGFKSVVSLPSGANGNTDFLNRVYELYFGDKEWILIATDMDSPGVKCAEEFTDCVIRKDYDGMIATDMPFHSLIVESCGNSYIQKCYEMLLPNLTMYQSSMIKFISNSEENPWSSSVIYNHAAVVSALGFTIG